MAFISLLAVYLFIFIVILAILAFIGSVLLVFGLVKRKKAVQRGKKYPYVCIVLGILFMAPPVLIVGGMVVTGVATTVRNKIAESGYENCVDKWKDRWVSDSAAEEEMLKEFIEAAESRDKDALMALYTDEIQNRRELSGQVDEFLAAYPGGFSAEDFESDGAHSESGGGEAYFDTDYEGVIDGEYYYISFGACHSDDEHEERVGLRYFYIKSEKAKVLEDRNDYVYATDSQYIDAGFSVEGEYETRRAGGYPYEFVPVDRKLTKDQVIDALKNTDTIEELTEILGEPNGRSERLCELLYELVPEGGEPRYVVITYDNYGKIILNCTHFEGTTGSGQWLDNNGNLTDE